jgi:hypothetical protein
MKKFFIWFFVALFAVCAAAGGYAYAKGVRNWDELVVFAQNEWQRLVGPKSNVPEAPENQPEPIVINLEEPEEPAPQVDAVTTSAPKPHYVAPPEEATDKFSIFTEGEDETINALILGHWVNVDNPSWHRVYTDEYSGNGYYWGKEWDESEDVTEADLVDYGNGWFEWKMDGNDVLELATTDMSESRVPFIYTIKKLSNKDLIYVEQRSTEKRSFSRLEAL